MSDRTILNRTRQLVTKRQLARMLHLDPTTLDRWRREGKFPPAIVLTDQTLRWRLSAVEEWLEAREAGQ